MKNKNENGVPQLRPRQEQQVSVGVSAVKERGVVRIEFGTPIGWLELDALGVANMMKFLGDKLRELQN